MVLAVPPGGPAVDHPHSLFQITATEIIHNSPWLNMWDCFKHQGVDCSTLAVVLICAMTEIRKPVI